MGEGDLQKDSNKGYRRPGEMPWPGDANQGDSTQPPAQTTSATDTEIHSMYGRSGIQNSDAQAHPPIRFMEGAPDPNVPDTKGRVWTETDGQGHVTRVHGRPHWQLPAPMSQDKSATMEDNERAVEERKNKVPGLASPEDTAKKHLDNHSAAMEQELLIRGYTDWAPNVLNNDLLGGLGGAAAALIFAPGPTKAATVARMAKGFAAGSIFTGGVLQYGLNDQIDKYGFHHDHGLEWKWFSDGIVIPAALWTAAKSGQVTRSIMGTSMLGKGMTALSIGLPVVLGVASSVVAHGTDKATGAEDRNPTYSNWCQQAWWDSAATTFVGGAVFSKFGKLPAVGAMVGTWLLARGYNALNPYPTPANEFDKSLAALDKVQTQRTAASMEDAIGHLREFGSFGRTAAMKNPWDWNNPLAIPGNLCEHYSELLKCRVNAHATAPELYKLATFFPDSQHSKGGYAGTIAHAIVNFEAGERALKWGAIGLEMPLGDSVGQDTKIDLGGEAMRKFIVARQEVDQCIEYAKKHEGQIPPGDASGKPINAEEVKMLTDLGDRIDHAIGEITGAHDNLDKVIDQVKNRLWTGNVAAVNELCADVRERAMFPKLKHSTLTPKLQAKLMRDAAMIDLARAEYIIEGNMKFQPNANGESHKQIAFLTSEMPKLALYFSESLRSLTWARTKMDKDDPALADLDHIAQRAYGLYVRAKQAGMPETMAMGRDLKDFQEGKLIDIAPNYANDAVNRAAIRNGRNPIKDELEQYANPDQKSSAQIEQERAAQIEQDRRNEAAAKESTQLQDQNATMQQAEIEIANRREAFARQHIQEEIKKFTTHTGRPPTPGEIEGIFDSLLEIAPTEPTEQINANPNPAQAQQPMDNPNQAAQPSYVPAQQQTPYAGQSSQPQILQGVDAQKEFEARIQQFRINHPGQRPTVAQMKELAQGLSLDGYNPSRATKPTPYVPGTAPQEALPVIQQSPPDQ